MKHLRGIMLILIAVGMLLAPTAMATQLPPLKFEKYELPNGLDVILHEDHAIPIVSVNIWYHVGSKNEKVGRTGFAHLFEHMMFQGSQHHDAEYFEPLEKAGGAINGSTEFDRTNYWENVPSNYLELALWMEADRLGFLLPAMTQEKLDNQRDVVKNERRQGVENQPYGKIDEIMLPLLFPTGHPYSWDVIGSMTDLSAASLEDVKDFFRQYYTPNNASLVVAGDFDPTVAKKLIERYFGPIPAGPPVDRVEAWSPRLESVVRANVEDNVSLPRLYYAWHSPAGYTPGDAECDLLSSILTSGKTSRLYKSLVYDKQIAQDVAAYQYSREIGGTFHIWATARPGHTLDELEAAIDAELRQILAKGVTADEVAQAQTGWEARFVRSLEEVGGFGGRADQLNGYNTMLGDPGRMQWDLDRYMNATAADVNRYAREVLDLNRRVIIHCVPQGTLTAAADEADRGTQPGPTPEPSFNPPAIQKTKLANGLDLWLVENHRLPLIQANLIFKAGWAADPAERPGAASLTSALLDEGTKKRTALDISEEAKSLGVSLATQSGFDGSSVRLNVLKKNLDRGLDLMADVTLNPTFPSEELERQRQIYLGRIMQEGKQPFTAAFKTFLRTLYGPGHPYAQPFTGSGTEESIKAITRDDLVRYYQTYYHPNNATIVVAGDITLAEAKTAFEKAFGAWQPVASSVPSIPAPPPLERTKVLIVDKPGAAQSIVIVGHLGVPRNDPDYTAVEVMNNAFGGQFTSRLNMNLREDKGYTYGAGAFFWGFRGVGPFACYAPVDTKYTQQTVTEMLKELHDVVGTRPLTDTEVADSRDNLIKGFPQGFESIGGIVGGMSDMITFNLPEDEWNTYVQRVRAIDGGTATKAATGHLHPDAVLIVIVGDRAKIEPGIRELNLGDISYADADQL